MKKLLHKWRLFVSLYIFSNSAEYQVVYEENPFNYYHRSCRMTYALANSYASIGSADIVRFGEDEVLWSYHK